MPDDELIALEHENWMTYLTGVVSCTSRDSVTRDGGVVTLLTGLPFDWLNQVLVEHEDATPDGVLAGIARARERGDPIVVRLREGIDDRFVRTMSQAGLEAAGEETSTPDKSARASGRSSDTARTPNRSLAHGARHDGVAWLEACARETLDGERAPGPTFVDWRGRPPP
jgi:hypothetical protein